MTRYDLIIRSDVVVGAEGPAEADLAVEDGKRLRRAWTRSTRDNQARLRKEPEQVSDLRITAGPYHFLARWEKGKENLHPLGEMTLWEGAQDIVVDRA
jgi:hypothetical protein